MPLYLDVHTSVDAAPDDVADAARADRDAGYRFGVRSRGYWFSLAGRRLFCLMEAPEPEAIRALHRSTHGLVPDEIWPVESESPAARPIKGGSSRCSRERFPAHGAG